MLIVAIAGVAVAAIVALVLVLVLTGDDDKKADSGSDNGGQPSDIIERQDADAVDALSCSGDQAQATIDMEFGDQTEGITIEMEKQGSSWCASGI